MQVKRFVADNMRLALNMVREDIGSEAVILSNKRVAEGVEILVALDPEGHLTNSPAKKESQAASQLSAVVDNSLRAASSNPFESHDQIVDHNREHVTARTTEPSKLERELEIMQKDTKNRARMLAASLNEKYSNSDTNKKAYTEAPASENDRFKQALAQSIEKSVEPLRSPGVNIDSLKNDIVSVSDDVKNHVQYQHQDSITHTGFDGLEEEAQLNADSELAQMRSELQVMRDMMEQQLSTVAWGQYTQKNPEKASFWRRLKRIGISASLCKQILSRSCSKKDSRAIWQEMMNELSQSIPVFGNDLVAAGGIFTFVGPTGAGKTTTIGKLAAQYVLKNGNSNIALVSTDTAKIAAYEQLRTFGRILNIPVKIVDKNNSLEKVLHNLRDKSLVLVDTSGFNRRDPRLSSQLNSISKLERRVSSILVLPSTSQCQVLKAAYHTYKTDNLKGCVITKLDESMSLGEVISLCAENSLPIAYSTDGQGVPDDIAVANGRKLVAKAINLAQNVDVDDEIMIDGLAKVSIAGM